MSVSIHVSWPQLNSFASTTLDEITFKTSAREALSTLLNQLGLKGFESTFQFFLRGAGVQLPIKDADVLLTAVDRHKWYKHLQSARDPSSLEPLGLIKQPMLVLGRRESLSLHHERSVKEQRAVVLLYSEALWTFLSGEFPTSNDQHLRLLAIAKAIDASPPELPEHCTMEKETIPYLKPELQQNLAFESSLAEAVSSLSSMSTSILFHLFLSICRRSPFYASFKTQITIPRQSLNNLFMVPPGKSQDHAPLILDVNNEAVILSSKEFPNTAVQFTLLPSACSLRSWVNYNDVIEFHLTGQTFVPFPLDSQISVPSPSKKLKSFEKSGLKSLEQCDAGVLFRGTCESAAYVASLLDRHALSIQWRLKELNMSMKRESESLL